MKRKLRLLSLLMGMLAMVATNAFANHGTHYGKVTVNSSGNGSVYIGTSNTAKTGNTTETWNCNGSSRNDAKTYYLFATPNDGYTFMGWYSDANFTNRVSGNSPYTLQITATSEDSGNPTTGNYYASFVANSKLRSTSTPLTELDAADPAIIKAQDGYYYMYSSEASSGSGIKVWRSGNMIDWQFITTIFAQRPENVNYTFLWAPEIAYINGKYVLYYANAEWGHEENTQICVATSDKPYGPFENNKILVNAHNSDHGAFNANVDNVIDPDLLDDGVNKYLVWGSWHGIHYIQLTADGTSLAENQRHSLVSGRGDDWKELEAPMVFKRDGYYYLIGSYGNTLDQDGSNPYKMRIARGQSLGGTFNNKSGQNLNRNSCTDWLATNEYVKNPGHCSKIIKDNNGKDFIFYHGYAKKNGNWDFGPRVLFMSPVTYDNNGWPVVQAPTPTTIVEVPEVDEPEEDNYTNFTINDTQLSCTNGGDTETVPVTLIGGTRYVQISNADQLILFASYVNAGNGGANAMLMNDIDMADKVYSPIGKDNKDYRFSGTFDGQGHRIMNLTLFSNPSSMCNGLIDVATGGATIKNLIMDKSCAVKVGNRNAALVSCCNFTDYGTKVTFENCGNEADVVGSDRNCAAFLGCNYSDAISVTIINCYNTGNIKGSGESAIYSGWLGGNNSTIENCYNIGDVSGVDGSNTYYRASGSVTYSNCYGYNNNQGTNMIDAGIVTSGELCYNLNGEDLGENWYQTIGTDAYPIPFPISKKVYKKNELTYANPTENLILDEAATTEPEVQYAEDITVKRTMKAEKWNTFMIPFDMTKEEIAEQLGDGAMVKELTNVELDGETYSMTFSETANGIEAGKPYMVLVPSAVTQFTANNKWISADIEPASINGLTYYGVYTSGYAPMESFIISDNKFYRVTSSVKLKAFRGYIAIDQSAGIKAVSFMFEDEDDVETAIDGINEEDAQTDVIYNLSGQRVQKAQKGLYIVNGKKVLF